MGVNCSWSVAASGADGIEHAGLVIGRELVAERLNWFRMTSVELVTIVYIDFRYAVCNCN